MNYMYRSILIGILSLGCIYTYKSTCLQEPVEKGPGFEIENKSPLNIAFRFFIKNKQISDTKLAPNHLFQWVIDLNDPLMIEIYEPLTHRIMHRFRIDAPGKTKYLAWDPRKFNKPARYMFPQGQSDFRFFLDNNVNQAEIRYLK
jgi:hypothetical protein